MYCVAPVTLTERGARDVAPAPFTGAISNEAFVAA